MTEQELDRLNSHLNELIITLILLASSAQEQISLLGSVCPGDEMAADFETQFTVNRSSYLAQGLLTSHQLTALDELDALMETLSGPQNLDFWCNPDALTKHPDWQSIRTFAKKCLAALGKSGFTIEVKQTRKLDIGPNGDPLMITWNQTLLVPPQNSL